MYTFALILFVLVCILLVVVILMQSSKGGLASTFGGVGGAGGVLSTRGAASFLQKATIVLGILYGLFCLVINNLGEPGSAPQQSIIQEKLNEQAQPQELPSSLPVQPETPPAQEQPSQPSPPNPEQ